MAVNSLANLANTNKPEKGGGGGGDTWIGVEFEVLLKGNRSDYSAFTETGAW